MCYYLKFGALDNGELCDASQELHEHRRFTGYRSCSSVILSRATNFVHSNLLRNWGCFFGGIGGSRRKGMMKLIPGKRINGYGSSLRDRSLTIGGERGKVGLKQPRLKRVCGSAHGNGGYFSPGEEY